MTTVIVIIMSCVEAHCTCAMLVPDCSLHIECTIIIYHYTTRIKLILLGENFHQIYKFANGQSESTLQEAVGPLDRVAC